MKKLFAAFAFACLSIPVFAQNLATVTANNIADVAGNGYCPIRALRS
jgi:hypothetical protein